MDKLRRNRNAILVFVLPGLIIYILLLIIPIIGSMVFSFFKWNGIRNSPMAFVGLNNFKTVLTNTNFWYSMKNIGWFMVLTLLTQLPIGLLLAVVLSSQMKGYKFFKAAFFVPQVLSTTVIGLVWYFILMPPGILNNTLGVLGMDSLIHMWLSDHKTAMTSIILVNTWAGIGFHMAVGYAAIQTIPESVMEAAALDGCTGLRRVILITIPMTWETIISSLVIIVTAVIKTFDLVYVMTEGGPNGLTDIPSTLLYKQAFLYDNYGGASAIGVFMFIISVLLTVATLRITKRESLEL